MQRRLILPIVKHDAREHCLEARSWTLRYLNADLFVLDRAQSRAIAIYAPDGMRGLKIELIAIAR